MTCPGCEFYCKLSFDETDEYPLPSGANQSTIILDAKNPTAPQPIIIRSEDDPPEIILNLGIPHVKDVEDGTCQLIAEGTEIVCEPEYGCKGYLRLKLLSIGSSYKLRVDTTMYPGDSETQDIDLHHNEECEDRVVYAIYLYNSLNIHIWACMVEIGCKRCRGNY